VSGPAISVRIARSDQDIQRCFVVMRQLRDHLQEEEFLPTVRSQQAGGFQLAFAEVDREVRAVAGFRFIDNLHSGRILYVDDLVTDAAVRSQGYGRALLDWLVEQARSMGCSRLELDSGVQRFDAHRFYLTNRMEIDSHHFTLKIE
jgi:GNAT superfamily N-acetyltransferase